MILDYKNEKIFIEPIPRGDFLIVNRSSLPNGLFPNGKRVYEFEGNVLKSEVFNPKNRKIIIADIILIILFIVMIGFSFFVTSKTCSKLLKIDPKLIDVNDL